MTQFIRAFVDRAATKAGGPIRFVAATEGRKADGIDLRMTGAQLERFRGNPVIGYGHRYWSRDDLPIGKATSVETDGDRLLADVVFDQGDEFAMEIERKYREGFLNAVSIGFSVTKWEGGNGDYWKGGVAEEWELDEISCVPVPMDAGALVESGRSERDGDVAGVVRAAVSDALEKFSAGLAESITQRTAGEQQPAEVASEQEAEPAVSDNAARDLLAAIALERGNA